MPGRSALDAFFAPQTVALIGATDRPGSVGHTILANLLNAKYRGKVFPVNPARTTVMNIPCYPTIAATPEKVDLAVVVTPASTVPQLIGDCVDAGVQSAIVISAGFKERGAEGADLERKIQAQLRRGTMRLVGPNCLGMMNPRIGLNATFAQDIARDGSVAFLSQSGALLTAVLDWSLREDVGFSAIVSTGSMLDVNWGDLIDFYGEDPQTRSILIYMESVGDARSFVSATREVALRKPIIIIKPGRTEAASRAAASHTGALTGSDDVLDAAIRRCGALRVQNIADLFHMAEALGKQPRPLGPRLTILTNAGGPGVLATDALIGGGGELTPLSEKTIAALNEFLPPHWSHNNPIDILGDADPDRYAKAIEIAIADPNSDGLLAILAPQGMTDPTQVAERLKPYARQKNKPVLASWMGGKVVAAGEAALNAAGVPTFPYPDTAARVFDYMWRYSYNLRGLYETSVLADDVEKSSQSKIQVTQLLDAVRKSGRRLLTEAESKQVLAIYGIPTVETRVAKNEDEAAAAAAAVGFPVVLKIHSETITHKTDVGGVQLNLPNADAVRSAYRAIQSSVTEKAGPQNFLGVTVQPMIRVEGYELIVGSSIDPQFGPVILFGSGGQLVEVYKDRALALPPLTSTLAQRLMEQTKVLTALKGVRGRKPVDLALLESILVRFSRLVVEQPWISEMDINPLTASAEKIIALDARIVLHDPATPEEKLPRPAIRPYPTQYVSRWRLKTGDEVVIRPIRPEDESLLIKFHESLSDRSVYLRYFHMEKLSSRVAHERLISKCFIDYDREMALIAELPAAPAETTGSAAPAAKKDATIIGIGRLTRTHPPGSAEVAVLIADAYQRSGLGMELLRRLIQFARDEKIQRLVAQTMLENAGMRSLASHSGFIVEPPTPQDADFVTAVLTL
jgi:acetyltransferase